MPWLKQAGAVLDAWYPGESNGTALAAVLFGQVDPGGHLPVTFPQSLSQVPASSPSQFPGVNGQVDYSEGIDVGYRYYDATNETPLFPFGYGLSYTSFRFSNLTITPASVHELELDPGATSCNCNGQSGPPGDRLRDRHQHGQGRRLGCRAALPRRPRRGGRAAAAAEGL